MKTRHALVATSAALMLVSLAVWLMFQSPPPDAVLAPAPTVGEVDPALPQTHEPESTTALDGTTRVENDGDERAASADEGDPRVIRILVNRPGRGGVRGADVIVLPLTDDMDKQLRQPGSLSPDKLPTIRLTTDSEGIATVVRSYEKYYIAARSAGCAPAGLFLDPTADQATIDLQDGYRVTGSVTLADGRPAVGATIKAAPELFQSALYAFSDDALQLTSLFFSSTTTVDADGRYEVSQVPGGFVEISANLEGFSSCMNGALQLPWQTQWDCVMHGADPVVGRITDAGTGVPIEHARVSAGIYDIIINRLVENCATYTDSEGRYSLDGVRSDDPKMLIIAFKPSYSREQRALDNFGNSRRREVNFTLEKGASLSGTVVTTEGTAIPQAILILHEEPDMDFVGIVGADDDGNFDVDFLSNGKSYTVLASPPRLAQDVTTIRKVKAPGSAPLEIIVDSCGSIRGKITSEGRPLVNGEVRLTILNPQGHKASGFSIETDDNGEYGFAFIPTGDHRLEFFSKDLAPTILEPVRVDPPRTDTVTYDQELGQGVPLAGWVVDDRGEPVGQAPIHLAFRGNAGEVGDYFPTVALSDQTGRFAFDHAPRSDSLVVVVEHDKYAPCVQAVGDISNTPRNVTITLTQAGSVSVEWLATDGTPYVGFEAEVRSRGQSSIIASDRSGLARVENLPPGTINVDVYRPFKLPDGTETELSRSDRVELATGEDRRLTFRDGGTAAILGKITGSDVEQSRRRIVVGLRRGSFSTHLSVIPPYDFHFLQLAPGSYEAKAQTFDAGPRLDSSMEVEVLEGEVAEIELRFDSAGVTGTVVDTQDNAVSGASITFVGEHEDSLKHPATSGDDGAFQVAGLSPGKPYEYFVSATSYATQQGYVAVPTNGRPSPLLLTMQPEGRCVVSIADLGGEPVRPSHATCVAVHSRISLPTLTATENTVTFVQGDSGTYQLSIEAPGFFPYRDDIEILSGRESTIDVQLRRPATLTLRAVRPDGSAAFGISPAIIDMARDSDAWIWISNGSVTAEPSDGRTDKSGKLTLRGLPEGIYSVTAVGITRTVDLKPTDDDPTLLTLQGL